MSVEVVVDFSIEVVVDFSVDDCKMDDGTVVEGTIGLKNKIG